MLSVSLAQAFAEKRKVRVVCGSTCTGTLPVHVDYRYCETEVNHKAKEKNVQAQTAKKRVYRHVLKSPGEPSYIYEY